MHEKASKMLPSISWSINISYYYWISKALFTCKMKIIYSQSCWEDYMRYIYINIYVCIYICHLASSYYMITI